MVECVQRHRAVMGSSGCRRARSCLSAQVRVLYFASEQPFTCNLSLFSFISLRLVRTYIGYFMQLESIRYTFHLLLQSPFLSTSDSLGRRIRNTQIVVAHECKQTEHNYNYNFQGTSGQILDILLICWKFIVGTWGSKRERRMGNMINVCYNVVYCMHRKTRVA